MNKTVEKYIWTRDGKTAKIIDNVFEIYRSDDFDETRDRFYRLGNEVRVSLSLEDADTVRADDYHQVKRSSV